MSAVVRPPVPLPRTRTSALLRALRAQPLLTFGVLVLVVVCVAAALAPLIAPYPADAGTATHPYQALSGPSSEHLFGTDQAGRDILTRVLYGARTSLGIAAFVLLVAALIGLTVGLVAGYLGGWVDSILMRITDVFLAFPSLLLATALAVTLEPSATHAAMAIAATWWPWYARLARAQATTIRHQGYADAARVLGAGRPRQILRHVLPNAATPVVVQMSLDAAGIILTAATLSYLGLGAQDPSPEWGLQVSQGQALASTSWWVVTFPGLAILITAVAFNFVGDGLQSALDPKRRGR